MRHWLVGILSLLLLVGVVGAAPYAYIPTSSMDSSNIVVIDTAKNNVVNEIPVDNAGDGVSISPGGSKVYVTNPARDSMYVIDTATNAITSTVNTDGTPFGVVASPDGKKIYVACRGLNNYVDVFDAVTNALIDKISSVDSPNGITISPDGSKVYATNFGGWHLPDTVSIIDTATDTFIATIPVGDSPYGVAVNPDGTRVYVANEESNTVSVIDTGTNTVISNVSVGSHPFGVTVGLDGTRVYVTNCLSNTVSVIDTATNSVIANVSVGTHPISISITPDGSRVYVVNGNDNNVSVIDTTTSSVIDSMYIGTYSQALGQFIGEIPVGPQPKIYPIANFSNNVTSGYVPLSVQFNDLSENETDRSWDFESDGNIDSTDENPVHTFTEPGTYTVNLIARNENGTDSKLAIITVSKPSVLVASFSATPTEGKAPLTVAFTDTSTGTPTSRYWAFGDGTTSTKQNITHKYTKTGKYTVKLSVKNSVGRSMVTKTGYIQVIEKPVASFSAEPTEGKAPLSVKFTDKSTGATSRYWAFGDGTTSTKQNITHKYTKTGKYTVKLSVKNSVGRSMVTKTKYINVN